MSAPSFVLHIEPDATCAPEVVAQLSPKLATLVHRYVSDADSLNAALNEREWSAILYGRNELNNTGTPHSFLDSMPGMACQLYLDKDGALNFLYVSEGCMDLLGVTSPELEQHPQLLLDRLHPDDRETFYRSMRQSSSQATPWNWEGRIVLKASRPTLSPPLVEQPATRLGHQETQPLSPSSSRFAGERGNGSLREAQVDEIKWLNLRAKHPVSDIQGTVWNGFMVNITQNKQTAIEIKRSRQRLRELSSHIESIKEEERMRIAREIHDDIGVLLTALKMDLAWLSQRLPKDNAALHEKTLDMANLLDTAGKSANNLVHSLRPGFLDCFGIVAAIEIEAREFTKRTGIPCKISKSSDNLDVSDTQSITLFRVFQETLNNIMKHAAASQVQVQICENATSLELIVTDNGKGFDNPARNKPRSFGLRGIQERIGQLGGKATITSKPGAGTQIAVRLPLQE